MDAQLVIALVLAVPVVLVLFAVARMLWRLWRGTEEFQPGGSMGRQMTGRTRDYPAAVAT